ncbi:MAG: NAD(P)-dependent oxidoreductase [Candidatus Thermoplasmatota archaeon]|nr:NAD(P)-dependent oxidoreductase [Candidatus Thermoplasmatota archaeon]
MSSLIIFGGSGQLGKSLSSVFPEAIPYSHSSDNRMADITNFEQLKEIFESERPEIVINASAFTNVDACESEKEKAFTVNSLSVMNIALLCREYSSKFIHFSTDYVFSGTKGKYSEGSVSDPINYYGFSKSVGDAYALSLQSSLVVRTSGVYGYGKNFPRFVYDNLHAGKSVNVIEGYYSPITAELLALSLKYLVDHNPDFSGILNIAGERVSRFDLAKTIAATFNFDSDLIFKTQKLLKMKALRPYDSSLDISKARKFIDFDFYSEDANMRSFRKMLGGS